MKKTKKRFLSMILSCVTCLSAVCGCLIACPVSAAGQAPATVIEDVDVTMTKPVAGMSVGEMSDVTVGDGQGTVIGMTWYTAGKRGVTSMASADRLEAGKTYWVYLTLQAPSGAYYAHTTGEKEVTPAITGLTLNREAVPDAEITTGFMLTAGVADGCFDGLIQYRQTAPADESVVYCTVILPLTLPRGSGTVDLNGVHLILDGRIGVVFHARIDEAVKDGYMTLSVPGGKTEKIYAQDCEKDGDGRYLFPYYVSSIQMSEEVRAGYYDADGGLLVSKSMSVEQYAKIVVEGDYPEATKTLVKAMINYGHFAQIPLARANGWTVGKDYTATGKYGDPTVDDSVFDPYAVVKTGTDESITAIRFSVILDSGTAIHLYLTADGMPTATVNGEATGDGRYLIRIPDIPSTALGDGFTVTVNEKITLTLSVLSYGNIVCRSGDADQINAMKALYEYYVASVAYAVANAS